jgi:hypothetical protein
LTTSEYESLPRPMNECTRPTASSGRWLVDCTNARESVVQPCLYSSYVPVAFFAKSVYHISSADQRNRVLIGSDLIVDLGAEVRSRHKDPKVSRAQPCNKPTDLLNPTEFVAA